MSEELESLRAEVSALRAEIAEQRDRSISRRRLLTGLAGMGAAGAAAVANAPSAGAADGDSVVLGQEHSSESPTSIESGGFGQAQYPEGAELEGTLMLRGNGLPGLWVRGTDTAVDVAGAQYGLKVFGSWFGVLAKTEEFFGVQGTGTTGYANGVAGIAQDKGIGLYGRSDKGPALFLEPSATSGGPAFNGGLDEPGAVSVDPNGDLWLCVNGQDAVWTRLLREDTAAGRVVPINPIRALDTRATGGRPSGSPAISGQKKGPLHGGEAITLDLAGAGSIPATASGVVGNLTVVNPDYSGYLVAIPSGSSSNSSALNFNAGEVVANSFTSALGPDGLTMRANGSSGRSYHLVVDITAYIT